MAANEGATMSSLSSSSSSEQSSSRKRKRERTAGDLRHHQPEIEENNNNSSKSPSINALGTITTEAGTTTDKPTNEGETSSTVVDPNSTNKLTEDASTAMGEKSESQVPDSHKLYVWGLSPEVDEAAVHRFFRHYGSIVSVQFYKQIFSRYCYVSFTTKEAAYQARREKHMKKLAGQRVLCNTCEQKEDADHIAVEQVIINNNFCEVRDRLREKYRNCGKFFVFLPPNLIDHDTNVGWAFIKFDTEENMSNALKLDVGLRVPGCPNVPTYKRSRVAGRHSYIFKDYKHRREPTNTRFDGHGDKAMIEA